MNPAQNEDFTIAQNEFASVLQTFARERLLQGREHFRTNWCALAELGVLGVFVPEELGGSGLDAVTTAVVLEALGYGARDTGFAFAVAAHLCASLTAVLHHGSTRQREQFVPALSNGRMVAAFAITEPESGSDVTNARTTARHECGSWVLNGCKCFVTNAPVADLLLVQACTERDAGWFGLTTFLVPAGQAGMVVTERGATVGLAGAPLGDIVLDECVVPDTARLGAVGSGAAVFAASMEWERTCLFAIYLGAMRRVLDATVARVRTRRSGGVLLGAHQAVSHQVVDMRIQLDLAQLAVHRAAGMIAAGQPCPAEAAVAKIAVSEAALRVAATAVQLGGAESFEDAEAVALLNDALPSRVFSGTNEVLRNNIARHMGLGRPLRTRNGKQ